MADLIEARPPWLPAGMTLEQGLAEMARRGPPVDLNALAAAPSTFRSGSTVAQVLRRFLPTNPLAGGDLSALATSLASKPINALSPQEVASSAATPPTTVAGNLIPGSPLASSVALMALLAAGTHKAIPVDYDPFKRMPTEVPVGAVPSAKASFAPPVMAGGPMLAEAAGQVAVPRPTTQASVPPVRYVTRTGMRDAYQLPGMEPGSAAAGSGTAADPATQNWLAGIS